MKLICYLSLGYPTLKRSIEVAREYGRAGCDVIEVDFPAADPYLDSPYIRGRMLDALSECDDYTAYMQAIQTIKRENPNAGIIVLSYEATITEIGPEAFATFCIENNLQDIIYIGNEYPRTRKLLMDMGLRIASYVRFHLPGEDIEAVRETNGFIYLQAKPGKLVHPEYRNLKDCVRYLRNELQIRRPIYCGVGIASEDDVRYAKEAGVDGVFVGSTVLKLHDDIPALAMKIRGLKEAAN